MDDGFVEIPDVIAGFPVHAMARDFPSMTQDAFEDLKASLKTYGQKEPVQVWNKAIIDGAHRMLALAQLGLKPLINKLVCSEVEAIELTYIRNLQRRHLTTVQKAYAVIAHEKRLLSARTAAAWKDKSKKPRKPTREGLAKRIGVTARTVQKVVAIERQTVPDVTEALRRGRISIDEAHLIAEMNIAEQHDALQARLASGRRLEKPSKCDANASRSRTQTFDAVITFVLEGYRCFDDVRPIMQRDPVFFVNEIGDMIDILKSIHEEALSICSHELAERAA